MSTIHKCIKHLDRRDRDFKVIHAHNDKRIYSEWSQLAQCLCNNPDVVKTVWLSGNELKDKTGVKLSQYVAASTTIYSLNLASNRFSSTTYLALAISLCVNTSLRELYLYNNTPVDKIRIELAFVDALRLNPIRPAYSKWMLFSTDCWFDDFALLDIIAERSTSPSMLEFLLYVHLDATT